MTFGRPNLATIFAASALFWAGSAAPAESSPEPCDSARVYGDLRGFHRIAYRRRND